MHRCAAAASSDGQLLILRSTVFPGVTERTHRYLAARSPHKILLAFCPERVVQGHSLKELQTLPQIVSGTSPEAVTRAAQLFAAIAPKIVRMVPNEAEFAKLFCQRLSVHPVRRHQPVLHDGGGCRARLPPLLAGLKEDYPRMRDLPGPGLAAGPCLYKDTLQLAAFSNHQFALGYSAIQVNEGLPAFFDVAAGKPLRARTK